MPPTTTASLFGAHLSTAGGLVNALDEAARLDDSVGATGSRRDRHAHIGRGTCGLACFRTIVNRRSFDRVPKILETPKGEDERGVPWDTANIRRLKGLIQRPPSSG